MKLWVVYALISMVFAGLTSVIAKIGLAGVSAELGIAIRTCFVFAFVLLFSVFAIQPSQLNTLTGNNYLWLGISAATTTVSWIFYYKAIKDGEVSTVALIDKGSVVVAVLLAFVILQEKITLRTIAGSMLIVSGLLVSAKK
ncbi:EamA family transporter [Roseimicrobium sp. ORNL1]|uniref:EamA family transporter n=1 Tax=Roseimicrobium sp. ORNL1 TaxID=2711231 RepID=UPI0013E10861|nr:EamA family transporter [Roseimicrobium sp. ORNL1]QIF03811.1 EamA family transporter [Roseimicrobium sp. ORNL1]